MIHNLVYALESPEDGKVYYVGKSGRGVSRAYNHINNSHNKEVSEWLKKLGRDPVVRILERNIEEDSLISKENFWIREMKVRGEPVLNKMIPSERQLQYRDYDVGKFVREKRQAVQLTQREFALKAGVGIRFLRDLEQGKESCRMDKILQVLSMFGATLIPVVK